MSSAISHPPRAQSPSCLMLPYGYQIDLDFIKYCENLTQLDPTDAELQRRQRRRQRQSMEVMLGIQLEMQQQMDQLNEFWERKPPEPPPRTHHHLQSVESPIVPYYAKQRKHETGSTKWDPSMTDVVDDFEKTLERSKKGKEQENRMEKSRVIVEDTGDCIPNKQSKFRHTTSEPTTIHAHIEPVIDAAPLDRPDSGVLRIRIRDLEEQTKLIPLLQMQIQALKEERIHLQTQLESRSSSTSSTSPHPHPVFQAHRVSPVSLNAMKIAPNVMPKRTTGTNTSSVFYRDVGSSPDVPAKMIQKSTSTEFVLKTEGDGGRLYTERDLKKAIEMAHSKMRKSSVTVGTQFSEIEKPKPKLCSIAVGTSAPLTRHASCGTEEQNLVKTTIKGITIAPSTVSPPAPPERQLSSLSLKDMAKVPITRTNATQTLNPTKHQQGTQYSPLLTNKATDSNDLIKLVHKFAMTDTSQKRDQIVHTGDLVKVQQIGTNTPAPVIASTRSTASNTNLLTVKSVGVNCEQTQNFAESLSLNNLGASSKIPRPSPMAQRKFVRQETFTVSTNPQEFKECPAEKLLKLTMTQPIHHNTASPRESPTRMNLASPVKEATPEPEMVRSPSVEPVDLIEEDEEDEAPVEHLKMPMSPSIEYLDDDDFASEEDDDDKFNYDQIPPSMGMRPPPTSISTIRLSQQNRVKVKPSKEMVAALKVLKDSLEKSSDPPESEIRTAREIASCEWFQISSTETSKSESVEDYLDFFEEQSWELLTFMVNLADKNGNTAMHYAVSHGNFDVVSILLDSKVTSINQTNNAGYTCVMLVSLAKLLVAEHTTVVRRLFKLADVNIRATKNSQTALMLAVSHGNGTIASMLVESSADINIQDDDGSTALMCAAEHGHLDIVKFLLAQPDCDSTKVDVDSNTALKISLEAGYHDIGCLLYAHEHLLRSKTTLKRTPSSMKSSTSSLN